MKNLLIALFLMTSVACTKTGYIDTGVSTTNENETMYEYFAGDTYNWTLVKQLIDRAGLESVFNGTNQIMFLGPVDNSVRRWMYDHRYKDVEEIPVDTCEKIIMRYTFSTVYQREDVPTGDGNFVGGVTLTSKAGNDVWFYSQKSNYNGNPNLVITSLFLIMKDTGEKAFIASSGIKKKNGVIHSLDDTHKIANF